MARLKNQYEFMAGMWFEGELYFNKYSLMLDFYTLSGSAQDQNIAADRISYFIYDVITRSIFIQEDDLTKIKLITKAGIPVLTVPGPGPFDPVVLAVIVTKINSILDDILVVAEAEITSEVSSPLTYVWDVADEDDEIHSLVNDEDDTRWWASADPRFGSYPADTDINKVEPFPVDWKMLDLAWIEEDELDATTPQFIVDIATKASGRTAGSNPTGTVIKADFTNGETINVKKPKPKKPKPKKPKPKKPKPKKPKK